MRLEEDIPPEELPKYIEEEEKKYEKNAAEIAAKQKKEIEDFQQKKRQQKEENKKALVTKANALSSKFVLSQEEEDLLKKKRKFTSTQKNYPGLVSRAKIAASTLSKLPVVSLSSLENTKKEIEQIQKSLGDEAPKITQPPTKKTYYISPNISNYLKKE